MSVNRQYKAGMFVSLFNDPEKLIELYNAVTGSELPSDTPVEIATLTGELFQDWQNDLAFVLGDRLVILIEHQASVNENMPIRLLIYVARVYEKLINHDALYREKLMKLPKPDFIVLYNGVDPFPEEKTLRLSDAYMEAPAGLGGLLELEVRVVNVNEGHNREFFEKSETLNGYAKFVSKVRGYQKLGGDTTAALINAVKDCVREGILAEYFEKNGSEVINMLTGEFDLERAKVIWKQEAWETGIEQGIEQGKEQGIAQGKEQGIAQGKEQGIAQGKEQGMGQSKKIVMLLKEGQAPEKIAEAVQVSVAKVMEWKILLD